MQLLRRRRMYLIISLIFLIGMASALVLYALRQNIDLYYTPTQLLEAHLTLTREVRLGGMVVPGTFRRLERTSQMAFDLTDLHHSITVYYDGLLPALFRSGQGIVAQGHFDGRGVFMANQVLAKHDSTYKPPVLEK